MSDDRTLIDTFITKRGVTKCPPRGSQEDRRRVKDNDRAIQKRMSRAARKGWIKRASR